MKAPRIIALIPARGGSKGLPNKNLRKLLGRSLLNRSVMHAIEARSIESVFVSTDDARIAAEAVGAGAAVIERPGHLSGDSATTESAISHALDALAFPPEVVVLLQCTSPIRSPTDVDAAVRLLLEGPYDTVLSVTRSDRFIWKRGERSMIPVNYDPSRRPRRQDVEPDFVENGSIYAFRPAGFRSSGSRLHGNIGAHVMGYWSSFEIDTLADLELCSWILQRQRRGSRLVPPLSAFRLLALDFDGVMTDNHVFTLESGLEAVCCNRSDGIGVEQLLAHGLQIVVLSTETNDVVRARCQKLGLSYRKGLGHRKADALREYAAEVKVPLEHVIYVGNDVNDRECMKLVGLSVAVSDAHPDILDEADWILEAAGGEGAVRELADHILKSGSSLADAPTPLQEVRGPR